MSFYAFIDCISQKNSDVVLAQDEINRLLAELLDKNQLYVNLSEIDDAQFKVSEEDQALNKAFYGEQP